MADTNQVVKMVPLSSIHPDENQPRKDFNAQRLAELKSSIQQHGIMSPLVVEDVGGGQYLLEDGERRFRAALELKLAKVPVVIVPVANEIDRLIRQFHLQEQHQGWSAIEKAVAIGHLADSMKMSVRKLAELLSLPERTISDYEAFYSLMERTAFQKSEVPIHHAKKIKFVVGATKRLYEKVFEEEFTTDLERALEKQIIVSIKTGDIKIPQDFTKLVDSFKSEPDLIKKYLKGKETVTKLYLESNAKAAHHARNVRQLGELMSGHIARMNELDAFKLLADDEKALTSLTRLQKLVNDLVNRLK